MTYRQKNGEQVWHFCTGDHFVEVIDADAPARELCHDCKEQAANDQCRNA
jgi:hypothetical protein